MNGPDPGGAAGGFEIVLPARRLSAPATVALTAPAGEAPRLLSDSLFEELVWFGSAAQCRARIDVLAQSGVRPLVVPVGAGGATARLLATL